MSYQSMKEAEAEQVRSAAPPSPEHIFQTLNAYQRAAALKGAIELELFTAIAEGANTVAAIAGRCHTSERGTRILCDYLKQEIAGFHQRLARVLEFTAADLNVREQPFQPFGRRLRPFASLIDNLTCGALRLFGDIVCRRHHVLR